MARAQYETDMKAPKVVRAFQRLANAGDLTAFEKARRYAETLCSPELEVLVRYRSGNGHLDISEFHRRVGSWCLSGTAYKVGQILLEEWVKELLSQNHKLNKYRRQR